MKLRYWPATLSLANTWTIARAVDSGGSDSFEVVFVELTDWDGVTGIGEAAPCSRYGESTASVEEFLDRVDARRLTFDDIDLSMARLEGVGEGEFAAKGAINMALLDGAARKAGQPIYDFLELGFSEKRHLTSFSIGIDSPKVIREKVKAAKNYPVLKLKLGGPSDRENLAALRQVAPGKTVRVDGNEAWKTRDEALRQIEWLANDPHIEFVEQPMPARSEPADLAWLKEKSPLPVMADESCINSKSIPLCADCFHAVNVKLVKTGGISEAFKTLQAARQRGLQTMIGCMIESSVLISAAAHLAELANYLDIDGNLLITNDPFEGVTARDGRISFADAPVPDGLRIRHRALAH